MKPGRLRRSLSQYQLPEHTSMLSAGWPAYNRTLREGTPALTEQILRACDQHDNRCRQVLKLSPSG